MFRAKSGGCLNQSGRQNGPCFGGRDLCISNGKDADFSALGSCSSELGHGYLLPDKDADKDEDAETDKDKDKSEAADAKSGSGSGAGAGAGAGGTASGGGVDPAHALTGRAQFAVAEIEVHVLRPGDDAEDDEEYGGLGTYGRHRNEYHY